MIADLLAKLDDDDAVVRQDAANALGDLGHQAAEAVDVLRQRLLSADLTSHDRTCAAWALSQIVPHGDVPIMADLLHVLRTATATPDADELRFYCAASIVSLGADPETMQTVKGLCAVDPYWRCRIRAGLEAEPDPAVELSRLASSLKYSWPSWE